MQDSGFVVLGFAALACGCTSGAGGTGALSVLLEGEGTITEGLDSGAGPENIADGWAVRFEKYLVTIGNVETHRSAEATTRAEAPDVFVVDLAQVPAAGLPLWSLQGLEAGRWEFFYQTPRVGSQSLRHGSVAREDYDRMALNRWTYWVEGVLTKSEGQTCPPASLASPGSSAPNGHMSGENACYDASSVRFAWGAAAETRFGPCEIDDVPGFAIAADGTRTVAVTIHGDHLFFNGFPEGNEGGTTRLAQWWADCDLNLDGTVTQEELERIAPGDLPEIDGRYQLGGSPVTPLNNMHDYVAAQLKTQGHFQGEGECPVGVVP